MFLYGDDFEYGNADFNYGLMEKMMDVKRM